MKYADRWIRAEHGGTRAKVVCLCSVSVTGVKTVTKGTLGRKGYVSRYSSPVTFHRWGKLGQALMQRLWRRAVCLLVQPAFFQDQGPKGCYRPQWDIHLHQS